MANEKPLAEAELEKLLHHVAILYLQSGRAIIGRLLSFDKDSLRIESETPGETAIISRAHVSTFRCANNEETQRHKRKRNASS